MTKIPFESVEQDRLRMAFRGARNDSRSTLVGYTNPAGEKIAWTGDDYSPYVQVINPSTNPVQVQVVSGSGGLATEIQGNVANDAVDSGNPVKVGGVAANLNGITAVSALGDRVNGAYDLNGRQQIVISGANRWTKFNTVLAGADTDFSITGAACVLGRLEVTGDAGSVDMYALVYDGTDATGTLVGRFLVPGEGTAIVDYTNQGGLTLAVGCFVQLTDDPGAVNAPAVGGFAHAQYAPV